jgi:hypothetical protein
MVKYYNLFSLIVSFSIHVIAGSGVERRNAYIEYTDMTSTSLYDMYLDLMRYGQMNETLWSNPEMKLLGGNFTVGGIPYLWIGDGTAVGKIHFDPFDNLLIQVNELNN